MFELIDSGGAYCVLLTSASIDLSRSPYIVNGKFKLESQLPDGAALYVSDDFRPAQATARSHDNPIETILARLGWPGYMFAMLHPDDLREISSATVQLLVTANSCGARLFLTTPPGLRIPSPIREMGALEFDNKSPAVLDAALLGLVVLLRQNFIPNVRLKDIVELFGHGARVSVGYAQHLDPRTAVNLALRQIANEGTPGKRVLILQTPQQVTSYADLNLSESTMDDYCVYGDDPTLEKTQACYYLG